MYLPQHLHLTEHHEGLSNWLVLFSALPAVCVVGFGAWYALTLAKGDKAKSEIAGPFLATALCYFVGVGIGMYFQAQEDAELKAKAAATASVDVAHDRSTGSTTTPYMIHSTATLLLPYMEQIAVYNLFNTDATPFGLSQYGPATATGTNWTTATGCLLHGKARGLAYDDRSANVVAVPSQDAIVRRWLCTERFARLDAVHAGAREWSR